MSLSEADKVAFAKWVMELLKENKAEIERTASENKSVTFDTDGYITSLEEKEKNYAGEEGKVVKLKSELQEQNKAANQKLGDLYKFASEAVEAIIGTIGKDHKLSGLLRQKRDSMSVKPPKTGDLPQKS